MNKNFDHFYFIWACLFCMVVFGCNVEKKSKITSWYNMPEMDYFLDNDTHNTLVDDNKIYVPKTEYIYEYSYIDSLSRPVICGIYFNSDCKTKSDVDCIAWGLFNDGNKRNDLYKVDFIKIYIYDSKGHNDLSNSQTIIKYEYHNKDSGKILFGEQTGLIEDSQQIFIHPPRNYAFIINEFNPFPIVKLPIEIGSSWKTQIYIPTTTAKKYDSRIKEDVSMETEYVITGAEQLVTNTFGTVIVYRILAKSKNEKYHSSLQAYFNQKLGFVKLEYLNIDGSKLILTLKEIHKTE